MAAGDGSCGLWRVSLRIVERSILDPENTGGFSEGPREIKAPPGRSELAQALTEFSWEGKAAVLEFENKMARPVAERAAFEVLKGRVGA